MASYLIKLGSDLYPREGFPDLMPLCLAVVQLQNRLLFDDGLGSGLNIGCRVYRDFICILDGRHWLIPHVRPILYVLSSTKVYMHAIIQPHFVIEVQATIPAN